MTEDLREKLVKVIADKWEAEGHPQYEEMLEKFIFHMTDAIEDIHLVSRILQNPTSADVATFGKLLHRFFLHALPHLVAAGQLYDYVPEIFPEQRGVHFLP
jgi:hypothetical protein